MLQKPQGREILIGAYLEYPTFGWLYTLFIVLLSCMCACMLSHFSHVLRVTLWTAARQAPLSTGFSRQEYWSALPCPPLGDLPDPGIEPVSLASLALAGGFFTTSTTWEAHHTPRKSIQHHPFHRTLLKTCHVQSLV